MKASVGFGGKLSAVVLREGKQIKKRNNLGVRWFRRLRGK